MRYICKNAENLCVNGKCQHAIPHDKEIHNQYSMFPMRCRHCVTVYTLDKDQSLPVVTEKGIKDA
jgi:hypothetical protein